MKRTVLHEGGSRLKKGVKGNLTDFKALVRDPVFLQYIIKCIIATMICYGLYRLFPRHQMHWSIISVLLVLAPEHADSVRLALDRIKANVIGAGIGLGAFLSHLPEAAGLPAAVVATILVCYFFRLKNPSRSALAAVVIVLIQETEENTAAAASERTLCVIVGCAVGLLVTFLFAMGERRNRVRKRCDDTGE
jgi:uncharacterized membrane protein YccC